MVCLLHGTGPSRVFAGYVAAERLEDLRTPPHFQIVTAYAGAPHVFFFAPQRLWYLIFQTAASNYRPVYATTKNIDDRRSWSTPKPLVTKSDRGKWIDFWVICDKTHPVPFYARDQRDVIATTTSVAAFPNGFAHPKTVYRGVHEAVHVVRSKNSKPVDAAADLEVAPNEVSSTLRTKVRTS